MFFSKNLRVKDQSFIKCTFILAALVFSSLVFSEDLDGVVTLNPTDDTYNKVGVGSNPVMRSSDWRNIFIRFDVSDIVRVEQATLRLYYDSPSRPTVASIVVGEASTDDWEENGVVPDSDFYLRFNTDLHLADPVPTPATHQGWVEIDLSDYVATQVSGDGVVSLIVQIYEAFHYRNIHSKENLSGNAPELVIVSGTRTDTDGDGVFDDEDAFPLDATETTDYDNDGTGDNADTDDDNDGALDADDAFPLDDTETTDTDGDLIGNNADTDDDDDGVLDDDDAFPLDDTETTDTDGDGIGDNSDPTPNGALPLIVINEFVVSNESSIADEAGGFDDWVELYNSGSAAVDIGGWYMSDDLTVPTSWQIPATDPAATTIAPGGYLLLWFDKEPGQGVLHIDAELGSSGEDIVLHDGVGIIDSYSYGPQLTDVSEGRMPDGSGAFRLLASTTPAAANDSTEVPSTPDFDNDGFPDSLDPDDDNDGVLDTEDTFPFDDTETSDNDGDLIGNNADTDDDNDGVLDDDDAFPLDATETTDTDGDGIGDNSDPTPNGAPTSIVINEFLASNGSIIADEAGQFDDWVELYNAGTTTVDIGGWYMSDDLTAPQAWQIPATDPAATTIAPGGYLLLWFDKEPEQGVLHIDAKLGSSGEDIVLHDGVNIVDSLSFGPQLSDVSEGRIPDGTGDFRLLASTTPAAANDPAIPPSATEIVEFSIPGGPYPASQAVELSSATPGATIYYTIDGTDPDINSTEYSGPISVASSIPIRAIATRSDLTTSDVTTNTYIINSNHDFIIIAASGDPALYYDPDTGMIPNYDEDIEVNVNLEIYDTDGTPMINQMAETEIQGGFSASLAQKSFAYKAKSSLGKGSFDYPLFPDEDLSEYLSITARNSGQDFNRTMFRDAFVTSLIRDLSDVEGLIRKSDIDMQAYRPAVTYINGEYYGITNLRERSDRRYIEAHYGYNRDEIILIDKVFDIKEGVLAPWVEFRDFLVNNDMSIQANADELAARMDIQSFIDYNVFEIFSANLDWPGNNTRTWRPIEDGGKWRWLMYDLDLTYSGGDPSHKTLSRMLVFNPDENNAQEWAIEFFQSMMENEGFRNQFLNRLSDEMNTLYKPSRVLARLDEFYQLYNTGVNERQQHADRWDGTALEYNNPQWWTMQIALDGFERFTTGGTEYPQGRIGYMIDDVLDNYPSIDAAVTLTVNTQPAAAGSVNVNTLSLSGAALPFTGTYFSDIAIPVSAKAAPGYVFTDWSNSTLGTNASGEITLTGDTMLTANFTQGSTSTVSIVISEINYNSADAQDSEDWVELYNPTGAAVDISGWWLTDESDDYFGLPANTIIPANGVLVLAADMTAFSAIYPQVSNVIGSFGQDPGGFGLSGKGEHVFLYNAAGILIDDVDFDDQDPWPESPDGDGPTLQLLEPAIDNGLPESWVGDIATPGVY